LKMEQRSEFRLADPILPQRLKKIMVRNGNSILGCQVTDASEHGLGFVVDKSFEGEVTMGQKLKIDFESVEVDAKVVNLHEEYADETYRFGVRLVEDKQLLPYHRLLTSS